MEQAGADALELNVYHARTDPRRAERGRAGDHSDGSRSEARSENSVAVKLSPFFTAFAHFALQLDGAGADGLVLFNRFYQPDIDVQELKYCALCTLSDSSDLLPRLRGIAALAARVKGSLAVTGGVHTALDVVKSTMAGAHVTQMVSALLRNGPGYLRKVRADLEAWMEENEWSSLAEMRGNMSQERIPNPQIYERANYMLMLQTWERM